MMTTTTDNLATTLEYLNLAIEYISKNKTVTQTAKGVAKQTGFAAGGAVIGGVALGPIGAFAGTVVGGAVGLACTEKYDGILQHVRKMDDQQKARLAQQIREAVGATPINSFYEWYCKPESQETVHTLIVAAIGLAVAANKSSIKN